MVSADALEACETSLTKRPRSQPISTPPVVPASPVAAVPAASSAGSADATPPAADEVARWEGEGGAPGSSTPDTLSQNIPADEKAEPDAVPAIETPEAKAIDEGAAALQAAMAAPLDPSLVASLRENLIGTIESWAEAGIVEISRVRDLLIDHGDWSPEETEKSAAAFSAIADCALAAGDSLRAERVVDWIDSASQAIDEMGLDPGDILDLNPETGNVVMNDGRRIALGR